MKKIKILMLVASCMLLILSFNACKDDEQTDPKPDDKPKETTCYLSGFSDEEGNLTIEYNNDNKIVKIKDEDGEYTITYDGAKMNKMDYTDGLSYSFVYTGNDITRVNSTNNGENNGYYTFEYQNGNIVKIEEYEYYGSSNELYQINEMTYTGNNLKSLMISNYDEDTEEMEVTLNMTDFKFDDKKNPLYDNKVLFYITDLGLFLGFSQNNVTNVGVKSEFLPLPLPITLNYTYTDKNYPKTVKGDFFLGEINSAYSYICK